MTYLRRTGRTLPEPLTHTLNRSGVLRPVVWSVRDNGAIVGFVSASEHPTSYRERRRGFRGFTAAGVASTPISLAEGVKARTHVRDLTADRRHW